ncbi:MAG: hypothetical protein AAF567_24135 [Actinomycetota bacterium]
MFALMNLLAAEGPNGRFIPSDPWELFWAALAFLVIFFFFVRRGVPAIREALDKAQASAVADATAADQAIAESKAKVAAASAELGDANEQADQIIAEAKDTAAQLRVDAAARTQQLVDDMWAKAQSDVAGMRTQASADISAEVASQAMGAAEEVVRSSLDAGGQNDLIESYISGLGA